MGPFGKNAFLDLNDQGKDRDDEGAVVGITLRFALNARLTGSQGFAPGKATTRQTKDRSKKTKNKDKNNQQKPETNQKRGHF
jgi:hypothetical protein